MRHRGSARRDRQHKRLKPLDRARKNGWAITREDLNDQEEAYVRKLEAIGLVPCNFRRYTDGSFDFGASPRWWASRKAAGSRARRSTKG